MCASILVCSIIYLMFTGFSEQAAYFVGKEFLTVAYRGAIAYCLVIAAAAVLILGVLLAPVAGVVILIALIIAAVGETAIGFCVGRFALYRLKLSFAENGVNSEFFDRVFMVFEANLVAYVILGVIILETLNFIPYVGWVLRSTLVLGLSFGAFISAFLNVFIYKNFFESPSLKPDRVIEDQNRSNQKRSKIREIILKGVKKH